MEPRIMEATFKRVVDTIFHNWTALNLALQHSRVHDDNPAEIFADFVNYIVNYCLYATDADQFAIKDALDEIMDQEFATLCEDDSTTQVAAVLYKFTQLITTGQMEAFEEEYNKLPVSSAISSCETSAAQMKNNKMLSELTLEDAPVAAAPEAPMAAQSEWIEVKGRKKH